MLRDRLPGMDSAGLTALRRDGFVILPDLLSTGALTAATRHANRLLDGVGWSDNDFDGRRTRRVYSVLSDVGDLERRRRLSAAPVPGGGDQRHLGAAPAARARSRAGASRSAPTNADLDSDASAVTAVLDWEWAHPDPVEDLAWCEWIVRMHHAPHVREDAVLTWQQRLEITAGWVE